MSVDVLIASWSTRGHGRTRALLSLSNRLSESYTVCVVTGDHGWPLETVQRHHGIDSDCSWETVGWKQGSRGLLFQDAVDRHDPDVIISFDGLLNGCLQRFDRPTVAYCRTTACRYSDEVWCPSKTVRDRFSDQIDSVCRAIYPVWYIDPDDTDRNRSITVMIHGRKSREAVSQLVGSYNVLFANNFTYDELKKYYHRTKVFLFPKADRFEPLGLMPIEAAAHGCNLVLPSNTGASEIYPEAVYENPVKSVEDGLKQDGNYVVPVSPTDPVNRIEAIL